MPPYHTINIHLKITEICLTFVLFDGYGRYAVGHASHLFFCARVCVSLSKSSQADLLNINAKMGITKQKNGKTHTHTRTLGN